MEQYKTVSAHQLFAMLDPEADMMQQLLELERQGISLDVSALPRGGAGRIGQRLQREADLAARGLLPAGLEEHDPLRLYWQDLEQLPRLEEPDPRLPRSRQVEGLLYLAAQEMLDFAGQGVLLLDLAQEGAIALMDALEAPHPTTQSLRWRIRQAMARAVCLHALESGEASRLLDAVRAYQQADRRLLTRLGRNPTPEELAQELELPVPEAQRLGKMVQEATAQSTEKPEEAEPERVEDTELFRLRAQVDELLEQLEELDRRILELRFGLAGAAPLSQPDAAKALRLELPELQAREQAAMALLRGSSSK